jgi:hypothetical protein
MGRVIRERVVGPRHGTRTSASTSGLRRSGRPVVPDGPPSRGSNTVISLHSTPRSSSSRRADSAWAATSCRPRIERSRHDHPVAAHRAGRTRPRGRVRVAGLACAPAGPADLLPGTQPLVRHEDPREWNVPTVAGTTAALGGVRPALTEPARRRSSPRSAPGGAPCRVAGGGTIGVRGAATLYGHGRRRWAGKTVRAGTF